MTKPTPYPKLGQRELGNSRHRMLHMATHPALVSYLRSLPGYTEARAAVLTVHAYKPQQTTPPPPPVTAMTNLIVDCIDMGRPIPDVLSDHVPDQDAFVRHQAAAGEAAYRARDLILERLDTCLDGSRDGIHQALTDGLAAVVEKAQKVTASGPRPDSAQAAIEQDRVADFKAQQGLEEDYATLRSLQSAAVTTDGNKVRLVGDARGNSFLRFVANPQDLPSGLDYLDTQRDHAVAGWSVPTPWPADWMAGSALWWFTEHRELRPWAPTVEQHDEAMQELRRHKRGAASPSATRKQARIDGEIRSQKRLAELRDDR